MLKTQSNFSLTRVISFLTVIGFLGFLIRLHYFPYEIPITLDGSSYFWYAIDMSLLGHFPSEYSFPNNGWPAFLSIFFYFFHSDNFLEYMYLQRSLSIAISVLTIIPVYLLCNRFFDKKYSMVGASLFVFEPRIIQNSILGITEPLAILLSTSAIFLFLSKNIKIIYASFGVAALAALVRYEIFLLIFPLSIMFFLRFRKEKNVILKYFFALAIFVLVLLPMAYIRYNTIGTDGIISHVAAGPGYYQHVANNSERTPFEVMSDFMFTGVTNSAKFLGWVLIPFYILLVPYGIFKIFKDREYKKTTIIVVFIFLSLPAFYAYSRGIQDTRYFYILFPLFALISLYTLNKIEFLKKSKVSIFLCIVIAIGVSFLFLNFKTVDYDHEREAFKIAAEVVKRTSVINHSYLKEFEIPESKYYRSAKIATLEVFPIPSTEIKDTIEFVEMSGFDTLEEYVEFGRTKGLKFLVVDNNPNQPQFLKVIFENEEEKVFLIKEFDSKDYGYDYHVKIFRIDYDKFDL